MESSDIKIITFRLGEVEKKLDSSARQMTLKLDQLITHNQKQYTAVLLERQARITLERRVHELESTLQDAQGDLVDVRVSLAEKIGPGAIAGFIVSIIVAVTQSFVGG